MHIRKQLFSILLAFILAITLTWKSYPFAQESHKDSLLKDSLLTQLEENPIFKLSVKVLQGKLPLERAKEIAVTDVMLKSLEKWELAVCLLRINELLEMKQYRQAYILSDLTWAAAKEVGSPLLIALSAEWLGDAMFYLQDPRLAWRQVELYKQALRFWQEKRDKEAIGRLQNSLGNAYCNLPTEDKSKNLKKAIACYKAALEIFTREDFPVDYAMTQNNLGNAYYDLPTGDRGENLKKAIACYKAALEIFTREKFPVKYATTQNNLGVAYSNLPTGDRGKNLKKAIACYKAALEIFTREDFPVQYAKTQHNLGIAYRNLPTGDRAENLKKAIACYKAALEIRTKEDFPVQYAGTQNNLGVAYYDLPTGDRGENLKKAIACYKAALEIFTREDFPVQYAKTQHNLGAAYHELPTGDRDKNLKEAIACYKAALEIYTKEDFPVQYAGTQNNLGNLYWSEEDWHNAYQAYKACLDTLEELRAGVFYTEAGLRGLGELFSKAYPKMSFTCSMIGKDKEAVEWLEKGKCRILALIIAQREVISSRASPEDISKFHRLIRRIEQLEREFEHSPDPEAVLKKLASLREKLAVVSSRIRKADPDFLPTAKPLTISEIRRLVPKRGRAALVIINVTTKGTFAYLLYGEGKDVAKKEVVFIKDFNSKVLIDIFWNIEHGWLSSYWEYLSAKSQKSRKRWMMSIDTVTSKIYNKLLAPIDKRLKKLRPSVKHLIFMPDRELCLLPLHAAHYNSKGNRHYILEDYRISYAPSCYLLWRCQERLARSKKSGFFGIFNPTLDLKYAEKEVERIAALFKKKKVLARKKATYKNISQEIGKFGYIHFSCHGRYNWEHPLESTLSISGTKGNYWLTLSEINRSFDLRGARLVVLSACETGIRDVREEAGEYVGLAAGFLQAGVGAVVSSLWAVNDVSTAFLMERFYKEMIKTGLSPTKALQKAQLWMLKADAGEIRTKIKSWEKDLTKKVAVRIDKGIIYEAIEDSDFPDYSHPYYWAGFTITGWK
jgi:CHAT domain-containing protein/tetratricopeptide (TPR) repeat protein